jgi:hypothetical protein
MGGHRHGPAAMYPRTPGNHWTGDWVGPRAGLDTEARGKIRCLCRGSNPDRPVVQSVVRKHGFYSKRFTKGTGRYSQVGITVMTRSSPTTHLWKRRGETMYSSYPFPISALDGGEWSSSRPGRALPPGKRPPLHIGQEARWAPEPVWTHRLEEKSAASVGDRTPIARSSSP